MTTPDSSIERLADKDLDINNELIATAVINTMVADAHAMPVHWYYQVNDIMQAFPNGIRQLYAAPARHPSSIMSLHSKRKGGRHIGDETLPEVVGSVILKGKARHWDQRQIHYHHGMKAGENTLNAHTILWMLQAVIEHNNRYHDSIFLKRYIEKMTAETPSHPDTYAESYHRGFFANWAQGKPASQCAAVTHDTPSIGGLVRIGPLVLLLFHQGYALSEVKSIAAIHLSLTHPDIHLKAICFQYIDLLHGLLMADSKEAKVGRLFKTLYQVAGKHFKHKAPELWCDNQVLGGLYSTACYITDSWPGLLFLAGKYPENTRQALISNAELGGDNVHRGAVLATILSLINGQRLDDWYDQLKLKGEINHCLKQLGVLQ